MRKATLFFLAAAGLCALCAQAQQRPRYKVRPRTPQELERWNAIPEWKAPAGHRSATALPKGVDNTLQPFFPPVFNQRSNSCSQASGARYVFTYEVNRLLDNTVTAEDKAHIFSYHFTWNFLNAGLDEGSHPELGYDIMKTTGAMSEADMPDESAATSSTTWATGYDKYLRAMYYRVKSYEKFTLKNREGIDRLRLFLYNRGEEGKAGGIVTFSCYSSDWQEAAYKGSSATGLKDIITRNGTDGPHALTICGYDDEVAYDLNQDGVITEDEKGAFIIVNSWGTWWATQGKCYYPYKLFLLPAAEGGLPEMSAQALTVEPELHTPQVVFRVQLTYTSRNDLYFVLGVADGAEATAPTVSLTYPAFYNQGGDYPMRGDGTHESFKTIEIGMDFTDALPRFASFKNPKYFLTVRKTALGKVGDGTVDAFSVTDYRTGKEYPGARKSVPITGRTVLSTDAQPAEVSANPNEWLQTDGKTAVSAPFLLKTADGQQHKLQFLDYDAEQGTVVIRHRKLP